MKKIMGVIIAAGLSASAIAQNFQSQPDVNQSTQQQFQQNQQNQQYQIDRSTNNGINGSMNNTAPGSGLDLQQQQIQQPQPSAKYRNQSEQNYNDINQNTQSSTKGQMQQKDITNSPELNNKGTGDSLLRTPAGAPEVNPEYTPRERTGRESGYILPNDSVRFAMINMPDPNQKNAKSKSQSKQTQEKAGLKERDKTANALPDWVKANRDDNPKVTNAPKEHRQCALNDELKNRQGAFKDKREFNGGEIAVNREKDGEESVKFHNDTEFYKFDRKQNGKERFTYGVTKDYETMELRKNEDGTAEIIYHGIFPNVDEAEDAIMNGIVVEDMGKACRGVFRE